MQQTSWSSPFVGTRLSPCGSTCGAACRRWLEQVPYCSPSLVNMKVLSLSPLPSGVVAGTQSHHVAGGEKAASGCNSKRDSVGRGATEPAFGVPAAAVKAEVQLPLDIKRCRTPSSCTPRRVPLPFQAPRCHQKFVSWQAQLAEEGAVGVSAHQAMAVPGSCPQLPLCASTTAQEQPAWPACSPTEATVKVCGDNMAKEESSETSGSSSGISAAFNTRAAPPHYAGQLEGTKVRVHLSSWLHS